MRETALGISLLALLLLGTSGCRVQVDKSNNGEGENVKIATPFGGISVNKDQTTAAELGLPAYPGSVLNPGEDGNRSAKVDLGFGAWKLRVRVAHYTTNDNRDQVLAFYRDALSEYGTVIECAGEKAVGTPVKTGEGLNCSDTGNDRSGHAHGSYPSGELELKAGSPRHQHIVSVKRNGSGTSFSLIALELPRDLDKDQGGTN